MSVELALTIITAIVSALSGASMGIVCTRVLTARWAIVRWHRRRSEDMLQGVQRKLRNNFWLFVLHVCADISEYE